MKKNIFSLFFIIIFIQNIFSMNTKPDGHNRALMWHPKNCWMTSVFSALINSKPLQMLKTYDIDITDEDSEELKKQKDLLKSLKGIMKQAYGRRDARKVETKPCYQTICKYYNIEEGRSFDANLFLIKFLNDICEAYKDLSDIFYIPQRDAIDVYTCYKRTFVPDRREPHYKSESLHKNELKIADTDKQDKFTLPAGLSRVNTQWGGEVIWSPDETYRLEYRGFTESKLEPAERIYGEKCKDNSCSTLSNEDYFQIKYARLTRAPKILIFHNEAQAGVKIPLELQVPKKFYKQKNTPLKYRLYSIVMDNPNEEHYYTFSRNIYTDGWYKYNYSEVSAVTEKDMNKVLILGKDGKNIPALIFYERID